MNHLFRVSLKRLVPPGLALLAAAVLLAPCNANATPYVVKITQQGPDVVATGSGEFDLSGLTSLGSGDYSAGAVVEPSAGWLVTGSQLYYELADVYTGFSGPPGFGSTTGVGAVGTGDDVELYVYYGKLTLPYGYRSGTPLTSGATWYPGHPVTIASLGMTPGTYRWTWGSAADQSFTIEIPGTTSVPEPAVLGMFGLGLLLLGGFATLRQRKPPQIG